MNYTQAQIDRANAVSLEDFLRTQGETLIKSGREYRWKEHDSLTVRGNKWFRHSQSKGGYPIDFVMEFYGKSFPEAVQLLTGESAEGQSEASTAPPTAFHLPLHNRTADRAIQYLTESRGLNQTLVEAFLLSGDIYEDAKRHNVVFVGRDRNGTPRYAHVRGTADPFRQDIAGSDKSYPFRYEGNGNQLFVFEAPIDLLSFICLYPQDWQTRSYLALGGVSGKALDRFLSERKDTKKVILCLDSDTAGSEACTRLAQSIPGEIAVIRLVPARKDWNDVLRQQGDIPSRKFIAETITLRELPTAQPVPMLRMADVELTSVEWLWFPYIPFGKLTIIQGNPGEGKTYFAMRLAAACTNRKPLPGMETLEPFNIIYQTAEDGLGDTVKPRLIEADADLERVLVIDDRDTPLTLADERIARAIRENSARLVIIDPVQAFLGADSQLFNLLCDKADDFYGGRLPVHVRLILDEFANIGQIPNFDKLIATIRSREISASIILQSQSQLKTIYKDAADTIVGNCDSTLFLGGKEKSTLKEISELLGKETIDLYNQSENRGSQVSHGLSYQKLGKELMTQDELAVMDGGKCIFMLRGVRPFLSDKYDLTRHPNYRYTADADPKNVFDMERYMKKQRAVVKPTDTFDVYEIDATT